jgi:hypothetical protein
METTSRVPGGSRFTATVKVDPQKGHDYFCRRPEHGITLDAKGVLEVPEENDFFAAIRKWYWDDGKAAAKARVYNKWLW